MNELAQQLPACSCCVVGCQFGSKCEGGSRFSSLEVSGLLCGENEGEGDLVNTVNKMNNGNRVKISVSHCG